jgi:choline-sulfatase
VADSVLYLVFDCLRADAITPERTPTLARLADAGCSFETCVAPAYWSLPSHASIFTGRPPHEHGRYHRGHRMESLPLVDAFADRGHTTLGLTSNIYFSRGQGFDAGFDAFHETRRPLDPRGLNPFSAVRRRQPPGGPAARTYLRVLADALGHDRPAASLGNYLRAVAMELDRRYDLRARLPGFDDDDDGFLRRASDRSERLLREALERHGESGEPLFAFANFMDVHYPYQPTERHLAAETDGRYDPADLRSLEPDLANSWVFLDEWFGGGVDEGDLDLVRAAYHAEVRAADERLGRVLDELDRRGLADETLVVVTSDHGEALGESDLRGERMVGHLGSLNDHLRTVPLVLAHPDIDAETVETPTPLAALSRQLIEDVGTLVDGPSRLARRTDPILFELPANPDHESSYARRENVPEWYVDRQVRTHAVAGLDGDWVVVAASDGELDAWHDATRRAPEEAPRALVTACTDAVEAYDEGNGRPAPDDLSADVEAQLEDLGYM